MKSADLIPAVRLIGMLVYFFLAAQGAFYHIGFGKALFNITAENFVGLRKAVDPAVRTPLKALYLSGLVSMLVWVAVADKSGGLLSYAPVVAALLLLVADLVLALKFSEPINELINSGLLNTEKAFANARDEWMKFIFIRGAISVSGFVILLLHLIFSK